MTILRRILIAVFLALTIFRPTFSTETTAEKTTNLNIWFVVDATGSMVASDVDGGKRRFEKVAEDITAISKHVSGAKYSLIVQDYTTYTAMPLTYNADAIIAAKSSVTPKSSIYSKATDLNQLLKYAADRIATYKTNNPDRRNAVIIMTDGEDVSGNRIEASVLSRAADSLFVFGYGSLAGTTIEEINSPYLIEKDGVISNDCVKYFGNNQDIVTNDAHCVVSKINEDNLKEIAKVSNGKYYHREDDKNIAEIANSLRSTATVINETTANVSSRKELYYLFAFGLLLSLLWEGEELLLKLLSEKENKHA